MRDSAGLAISASGVSCAWRVFIELKKRDGTGVAHVSVTRVMPSVSDPKPDCIRIQSGQWIPMQEGKNDPKNRKKFQISCFEVLAHVLFLGLNAFPVAWTSFIEA